MKVTVSIGLESADEIRNVLHVEHAGGCTSLHAEQGTVTLDIADGQAIVVGVPVELHDDPEGAAHGIHTAPPTTAAVAPQLHETVRLPPHDFDPRN